MGIVLSLPEKDLPPYLHENGKRYWLTITADIRGEWNIGYSSNGKQYLDWSAIGGNQTINQALFTLREAYKLYKNNAF